MNKLLSRRNLQKALENKDSLVSLSLSALILITILCVILESIASFRHHYSFLFTLFEIVSSFIFLIEYMLRCYLADLVNKKYKGFLGRVHYLFSPLAIIDLVALLTFFLSVDLRVLRIFRIMRLYRYSIGLYTLVKILQEKRREFFSVFSILALALLVSSTMLYHLENSAQPDAFSSIPTAMWWSIATLTTVGYGDIAPITPLGRMVGGITSILGVMMFALPTAIISSGFMEHFRLLQSKKRRGKSPKN